jgi:histidyl-tRNA synthetase
MKYKRPRGTNDILPGQVGDWQRAEAIFREVCRVFCYREIRTPAFEPTDLFSRTSGESSEVVSKQMYTFDDRGGESMTLRPEGTAPVVRAYIEHGLHVSEPLFKVYYICPIFRYERPQKGRLRQHHQFGIEAIGALDPALDVEVISVGMALFERVGIEGAAIHVNSVGCPVCRPGYREALRSAAEPHLGTLCEDCRRRYDVNPLRMLDCKVEQCQPVKERLPHAVDHLCEECAGHFAGVREGLDEAGLPHEVDHLLVRGLDYYTKTAFEYLHGGLGAQNALGGGGRYDGLVEMCGGPPTPGIGFGIGVERVLLAADSSRPASAGELSRADVLVATASGSMYAMEFKLARTDVFVAKAGSVPAGYVDGVVRALRAQGFAAERDYLGRSLKSQMKQADKSGARYAVIIGEEEAAAGTVTLRNLQTQEQRPIPVGDLAAQLAASAAPTA